MVIPPSADVARCSRSLNQHGILEATAKGKEGSPKRSLVQQAVGMRAAALPQKGLRVVIFGLGLMPVQSREIATPYGLSRTCLESAHRVRNQLKNRTVCTAYLAVICFRTLIRAPSWQ